MPRPYLFEATGIGSGSREIRSCTALSPLVSPPSSSPLAAPSSSTNIRSPPQRRSRPPAYVSDIGVQPTSRAVTEERRRRLGRDDDRRARLDPRHAPASSASLPITLRDARPAVIER